MPISYNNQMEWVGKPADPATFYQSGFTIGMHLGAQQAAQMYQQQQLEMQRQHELMSAQEQMVEKSYQAQVLGMKAQEMARKHQANYEFRSRVASGEDPSQVLMELAPELGENPASIIHDRASEGQSQAMMAFRQANMQRLNQDAKARLEEQRLNREERAREADQRMKGSSAIKPEVQVIGGKEFLVNPKTGHYEPLNKTVNKVSFISQNVSKWMNDFGVDENEAAKRLGKFYDDNLVTQPTTPTIEPQQTSDQSGVAGDNTMPDAPVGPTALTNSIVPVAPGGKIKVRNPSGKVGVIPSSQLDAALAQGYSKVE